MKEIYVLVESHLGSTDATPLIAHTTEQGAAMEMVAYEPARQRHMWVCCIQLVDDHDD